MTRYLEVLFRYKFRLLALALLLPAVASAVDLQLERSYSAYEVVWVNDPGNFGAAATAAVGYNTYETPAQNDVQMLLSVIGTQDFDEALADDLVSQGAISANGRANMIASLSQLTVYLGAPSGSSGSSASAGGVTTGGLASDHTLTIGYMCSQASLCTRVVSDALDIFRARYLELKTRAADSAKAAWTQTLDDAQSKLTAATVALDSYLADLEKQAAQARAKHQPIPDSSQDPKLISLQHDVALAQSAVDAARAELQRIDLLTQVAAAITQAMYVVEGPKIAAGIFGFKSVQKNSLKNLAFIWLGCLAVALAYLILVALVDRTARDPAELDRKFGKRVVTIPSFPTDAPAWQFWRRPMSPRTL